MKRMIQTATVAIFVVLVTASFGFAEYVAAGNGNFPYFHFGCLVLGGLVITSVKHKYVKMYATEAIASFAMYAMLVALFTAPVVNGIKALVS